MQSNQLFVCSRLFLMIILPLSSENSTEIENSHRFSTYFVLQCMF